MDDNSAILLDSFLCVCVFFFSFGRDRENNKGCVASVLFLFQRTVWFERGFLNLIYLQDDCEYIINKKEG